MTMHAYAKRDIGQGIRTQLGISSTDLPRFQAIDAQLWGAIHKAMSSDLSLVELEWVHMSAQLSQMMKTATAEVIGKLAESSVCSFISEIDEEKFLTHFGRHEPWQSLQVDLRINYYRARFASIYWCSVRDYAVKSKRDCMSIFHLPWSFIEVLSESNTSQIIDFCHGFPTLQRFRLTCESDDCIRIGNIVNDYSHLSVYPQVLLPAKLIKSNHCSGFIHRDYYRDMKYGY